jgi:hypothetical protein
LGDFAGMMEGAEGEGDDDDEEGDSEKPKKKAVKVPKSDNKQAVGEEAKQECKQQ